MYRTSLTIFKLCFEVFSYYRIMYSVRLLLTDIPRRNILLDLEYNYLIDLLKYNAMLHFYAAFVIIMEYDKLNKHMPSNQRLALSMNDWNVGTVSSLS